MNDLTTNEAINRRRYDYLARGSPWSKGSMRNLYEFFKSSKPSVNWTQVFELPRHAGGHQA